MPNEFATELAVDSTLDLRLPKRSDSDYEIDAVSKARIIFETLVEEQPITERSLVRKTEFPKNLVFRTLRTYRIGGWALKNDRNEWCVGRSFLRIASKTLGENP